MSLRMSENGWETDFLKRANMMTKIITPLLTNIIDYFMV